jgi:hypothetical protein
MRDRTMILAGLALCLGLITWPVWRTLAAPPPAAPALARPANATECVAPTAYMRASHMVLLNDWRETVVRTGARTYRTPSGREVQMSLTGTCIRACHTDKAQFCDRCHDYASVKPTCWNCHVSESRQLAAVSDLPAAVSGQPAAVSGQLAAYGRQPITRDAMPMAVDQRSVRDPLPAARNQLTAEGGVR